jgi:hypothetical protein
MLKINNPKLTERQDSVYGARHNTQSFEQINQLWSTLLIPQAALYELALTGSMRTLIVKALFHD